MNVVIKLGKARPPWPLLFTAMMAEVPHQEFTLLKKEMRRNNLPHGRYGYIR